jgi:hypothetical protein
MWAPMSGFEAFFFVVLFIIFMSVYALKGNGDDAFSAVIGFVKFFAFLIFFGILLLPLMIISPIVYPFVFIFGLLYIVFGSKKRDETPVANTKSIDIEIVSSKPTVSILGVQYGNKRTQDDSTTQPDETSYLGDKNKVPKIPEALDVEGVMIKIHHNHDATLDPQYPKVTLSDDKTALTISTHPKSTIKEIYLDNATKSADGSIEAEIRAVYDDGIE